MLALLLKNKFKSSYLGLVKGQAREKRNRVIGFTVGAIVFFIVFFLSKNFIDFIYKNIDQPTADALLSKALSFIFGATFIFIMFTGIATTLLTLFTSKELDLLMSLPISLRVIFTYKFIESYIVNSYFTDRKIFPILIAYGLTSNTKIAYYPVMIIIVLILYTIPTSIGALLGLALIRIINPNRAREIIGIVSGIFGLVIVLAFQIIPRYFLKNSINIANIENSNIWKILNTYLERPLFKFLPTSWAAEALHAIYKGNIQIFLLNFILVIIVGAFLIFICILISQRLYYYGWANTNQFAIRRKRIKEKRQFAEKYSAGIKVSVSTDDKQIAGTTVRKTSRDFRVAGFGRTNLSSIYYSIIIKDFKLFFRDYRKLFQVLSPVFILLVVFYFSYSGNLKNQQINPIIFSLDARTIEFLLIPLFISGFTNLTLSSNSIGSEGLNFWIIKSSPVSARTLLRIKILFGTIVSLIFGFIIIFAVFLFIRPPIFYFYLEFVFVILFSYGISAITTSVGAIFPEFKPEYSRRNNITFIGSLLTIAGLVIYFLIFAGTIFGCFALGYYTGLPGIILMLIIIALEASLATIILYTFANFAAYILGNREWNY
ncbi:MAG: hypothetical protein M1326_00335 [Cyanobacteria bacterium]|nr:hypothetical protein [Cyanobacteriota bacterium]